MLLEIQQGRSIRPMKPLLSWELKPGMELTLPVELESILFREGFAEQIGSAANSPVEDKQWD